MKLHWYLILSEKHARLLQLYGYLVNEEQIFVRLSFKAILRNAGMCLFRLLSLFGIVTHSGRPCMR
jgi:hypothetical protein